MKNNKNCIAAIFVVFMGIITGCCLNAEDKIKYKLDIQYETEKDSEVYKKAGLKCNFTNLFDKRVEKFILACSIYDENNVTIFWGAQFGVIGFVEPGETLEFVLDLDELYDKADRPIAGADFAYVPFVIFDDGSEWSDPLGIEYGNY